MSRTFSSFAVALLSLFALALAPRVAHAQSPPRGYERVDGKSFVVERMPFDAARAKVALDLLETARAKVEDRLGETLGWPQPLVVLAPTDDEFVRRFTEIAGAHPAGDEVAVAFPSLGTIVVRGPRVDQSGLGLLYVLRHEIAHVVLWRVVHARGQRDLPRWLDEGLAEYAAGCELSREDELELAARAKAGTLEDLVTLESRFPHHAAGARAYRESFAFVQWLDGHAQHGVKGVVRALAEGETASAAIKLTTGEDQHTNELMWRLDAAQKGSILESLVRSPEFWWGLVAVLAILAFVRQAHATRQLKKKLD